MGVQCRIVPAETILELRGQRFVSHQERRLRSFSPITGTDPSKPQGKGTELTRVTAAPNAERHGRGKSVPPDPFGSLCSGSCGFPCSGSGVTRIPAFAPCGRRDAKSSDVLHRLTRISRKRGFDPGDFRMIGCGARIAAEIRPSLQTAFEPRTPATRRNCYAAFRAKCWSCSAHTCLTRSSNTAVRSCSQTNASSLYRHQGQ